MGAMQELGSLSFLQAQMGMVDGGREIDGIGNVDVEGENSCAA